MVFVRCRFYGSHSVGLGPCNFAERPTCGPSRPVSLQPSGGSRKPRRHPLRPQVFSEAPLSNGGYAIEWPQHLETLGGCSHAYLHILLRSREDIVSSAASGSASYLGCTVSAVAQIPSGQPHFSADECEAMTAHRASPFHTYSEIPPLIHPHTLPSRRHCAEPSDPSPHSEP